MRIRFYGGRVLSGRPLQPQNAEVWVENDRISYVGPARPDAPAFDREIDLKGDLLMPGFKNAHTHSAMTFLRSYADDLPLHDWLNKQVFPMEAKLTGDDVYHLAKLAILEYLAGGITANFDMYMFTAENAAASCTVTRRFTQITRSISRFTNPRSCETVSTVMRRRSTSSVP